MNQRQIVEIAAMIAANSAHVIEGTARVPDAALQKYWSASKQKSNVWRREIDGNAIIRTSDSTEDQLMRWDILEPVLEEIFVSEILTRVWGAILAASDQRRGIKHSEPFARSTLIAHLECRHLALQQLLDGEPISPTAVAKVDRLRRRTERWTDMCLGHLMLNYSIRDFIFDSRRALDFGEDSMINPTNAQSTAAWSMVLASLRIAFPDMTPFGFETAEFDQQINDAIIACFPTDAFHQDGPMKSLTLLRIDRDGITAESQMQKEDWRFPEVTTSSVDPNPNFGFGSDLTLSFTDLLRRANEKN